MRGCHDPAGGRGWTPRNEDRSVVIRAQPGAGPANRIQSPPLWRTPETVAIRGEARQRSYEDGTGSCSATNREPRPAKPPDRASQMSPGIDPLYLFGCGLFVAQAGVYQCRMGTCPLPEVIRAGSAGSQPPCWPRAENMQRTESGARASSQSVQARQPPRKRTGRTDVHREGGGN